jgi:hypothetical protein
MLTVLKRSPVTVNNALAAVDDFYIRGAWLVRSGPDLPRRGRAAALVPRTPSAVEHTTMYFKEMAVEHAAASRCEQRGLQLHRQHGSGVLPKPFAHE